MGEYLIGVDIGTTGTKSGLFDTEGVLLAQAYEESLLYYPKPGWVEQELEDFYHLAIKTIRRVMEKADIRPEEVAAITIDGQMSGIGMIDQDWNPVARYDSWLDTRCEPYIQFMQRRAGKEVLKKTGCPPTYAHGPKILWWKEERPEVFKRVAKFIVPGCYVAGKMAALSSFDAFIDYTYLHYTGFANIQEMIWDNELCDMFSIPKEKLPRIVKPWDIIGHLSKEAADYCGLVEGIPIAAGAGDTTTSYLGAGIVQPGIIFDVAGTASVLASCTNEFSPDLKYKTIMCSRSVIQNLWNPIAFINGGGLCLRWFRDEMAHQETKEVDAKGENPYEFLDRLAAEISPGSDKLIFIPHLGGRVLPAQPNLRGSWVGFSWGQSKNHFYRSILEGIAYEYYYYLKIMKNLYPLLEFKEVRVLGGGSKSKLWNKIKADTLNLPYTIVTQQEPAILGSAIIAGYAVGLFDNLAKTSQEFVQVKDRLEPRAEYHEHYQQYAEIYLNLIDNLTDTFQRLAQLKEPSWSGPE
jgi:xylulokinase